ncbi:hypothetical protein [Serratia fonticola]|uniref:hypothetical protein n=1 Tax=Serratia fonticola TaxID=47917 RepID=UPI00301DBC2D
MFRILMLTFWSGVVVVILVGIPMSIQSAYRQVVTNTTDRYAHRLTVPPPGRRPTYTHLTLSFDAIDVVARTVTLSLKGYRHCDAACPAFQDTLIFSAPPERDNGSVPTSTAIALPSNEAWFDAQVTLPVSGRLRNYPFDDYGLRVGIAVLRTQAGQQRYLQEDEDAGAYNLTVDESISGMQLSRPPALLRAGEITPAHLPYRYFMAFSADFDRPLYMKFFMTLIVSLFSVATLYILASTTFEKIIINTGSVIFGFWATRSLVLGPLPQYVTFMDLVLGLVIVCVLLSIALHAAVHYRRMIRTRVGDTPPQDGEEK